MIPTVRWLSFAPGSAVALVALAGHASSQEELFSIAGNARGGNLGDTVAIVGDMNNDGVPDLAVGVLQQSFLSLSSNSTVIVKSGKTGVTLVTFTVDQPGSHLGMSICGVGDVDFDGRPDILIGVPYAAGNGVLSGRTFVASHFLGVLPMTLVHLNGAAAGDQFGKAVGYTGPTHRFVVGAPGSDVGGTNAGTVSMYNFPFVGSPGGLLYERHGSKDNEQLGWSIASGFDVNGDFTNDVAVGAPGYFENGSDAGRVQVYSGSGFQILTTLASGIPGQRFGHSLAMIADMSGDSRGDVVVGAPAHNNGAGAVHVHSGADGSLLYSRFGTAGSRFGWSVSDGGNVLGSGTTSFIVGAPGDPLAGDLGSVSQFSGPNGSLLHFLQGPIAGGGFGNSVGGAKDLTGDNRADWIVGAPHTQVVHPEEGAAYVYDGVSKTQVFMFEGQSSGDRFGTALCGIGDVNGDGAPDFIVGSPTATHTDGSAPPYTTTFWHAGAVQCISGADRATVLWTARGSNPRDEFGTALEPMGDVNGDGISDVAVGAPQRSAAIPSTGYVRIASGADGSTLATIAGAGLDREFGSALGTAGDFDGDGIAELLIGSPGFDTDRGRVVRVDSGPWTVGLTWTGSGAAERFGESVAGTGDVNNDGNRDVAIGAPKNSAFASEMGRVYVKSGVADVSLGFLRGTQAGERFGASVCPLRADAKDAIAVGSPGFHATLAGSTGPGKVSLVDVRTLAVYASLTSTVAFEGLGTRVVNIGDYNLDGFDDVGAFGPMAAAPPGSGRVRILGGHNAAEMYRFATNTGVADYGSAMAGGQDLNGDGTLDLLVGAPYSSVAGPQTGSVHAWSLRPIGVDYFGTGTVGCTGPQTIRANTSPKLSTPFYGYGIDNAPQSSLGLLLVADSADVAGSDPFAIGVKLHVDLFTATEAFVYDVPSGSAGNGLVLTPIGNHPSLVGTTYYVQSLWAWSACPLPPFHLSTSSAAAVTIQAQ